MQDNYFRMIITESEIWDRFNNKSIPIDIKWLETVYSLKLPQELRHLIGERIGLFSEQGWELIKKLLKENGNQPELIYAAGICSHKEARDFLLECLEIRSEPQINVINALACWGAFVPIEDLRKIFNNKSLNMRIAGLNILSYKSHLLNEVELLDLVEELLIDFREEVVINTIRILQRRNEDKIIKRISRLAIESSDGIVEVALVALGTIGTRQSSLELKKLKRKLVNINHQEIAHNQIIHQYTSS